MLSFASRGSEGSQTHSELASGPLFLAAIRHGSRAHVQVSASMPPRGLDDTSVGTVESVASVAAPEVHEKLW